MNTCQNERTVASTHVYYINKNMYNRFFEKSAKKRKEQKIWDGGH